MASKICCLSLLMLMCSGLFAQPTNTQQALISIERIWDRAEHNAFTDLTFFRDQWYCTFREGTGHIPGVNGSIRIIASRDGQNWYSVALISEPGIDLRDPKISITPDKRLMINMEAAYYEGRTVLKRESWVAFSDKKGKRFDQGQKVNLPASIATNDDWLWRVTWHKGEGYGVIYQPRDEEWDIRLLKTTDGVSYSLVTTFDIQGKPSEATVRFDAEDRMIALVRRDGDNKMGTIGQSLPPYSSWTWKQLDWQLGGPNFVELPDGRLLCATRDYTGKERTTSVAFINTRGGYTPILDFPSGGDTSYPGMVIRDGQLYISYYSGHEGKANIYLAKLSVAGLNSLTSSP